MRSTVLFRLGDVTAARSKSQWVRTNSLKRLLYSGPTLAVVAPGAGTSWSRTLFFLLNRASETRILWGCLYRLCGTESDLLVLIETLRGHSDPP